MDVTAFGKIDLETSLLTDQALVTPGLKTDGPVLNTVREFRHAASALTGGDSRIASVV